MTHYEGSFTAIPGWDDPDVSDRLFQKGALLYQEYNKRWVNVLKWSGQAATFFGFAVGFALMGWVDHLYSGGWGVMGFMLIFTGLCAFLGALMIRGAIRDMPFKVYEGGVTLSTVPVHDGWAGRETFVPASDIVKVTGEITHPPKSGPVYYYVFHRKGGDTFWVNAKDRRRVTPLLKEVLDCPVEEPG